VSVVRERQERPVLGREREQAEGRGADGEAVARHRRAEREGPSEGGGLRLGQGTDAVERGPEEVGEDGERKLALRLDAARAQDSHVVVRAGRVLEQRRLADARLAPEDECAATPAARVREEGVQAGALRLAPDQHAAIVGERWPPSKCAQPKWAVLDPRSWPPVGDRRRVSGAKREPRRERRDSKPRPPA
jgi:hypothetical protein